MANPKKMQRATLLDTANIGSPDEDNLQPIQPFSDMVFAGGTRTDVLFFSTRLFDLRNDARPLLWICWRLWKPRGPLELWQILSSRKSLVSAQPKDGMGHSAWLTDSEQVFSSPITTTSRTEQWQLLPSKPACFCCGSVRSSLLETRNSQQMRTSAPIQDNVSAEEQ